jgi:hypothetical protein
MEEILREPVELTESEPLLPLCTAATPAIVWEGFSGPLHARVRGTKRWSTRLTICDQG